MSRKPFNRSDFIGGGGPGLAKLRAAGLKPETVRRGMGPGSGIVQLRALMAKGDWRGAILMAASWGDCPEEVARGREAIQRPAFQLQLRRDPVAIIQAAKAALKRRYEDEQ